MFRAIFITAAAISATTAGLKPLNTASTAGHCRHHSAPARYPMTDEDGGIDRYQTGSRLCKSNHIDELFLVNQVLFLHYLLLYQGQHRIAAA